MKNSKIDLLNIFQILFEQSFVIFENFDKIKLRTNENRNNYKYIKEYILIIFLLICSTILSKSYSSVLLDLYFNIKTKPFINTIEEMISNKEIGIMINNPVLKDLSTTHSQYVKIIESRFKEYRDIFLKSIDRSILFNAQNILLKGVIERRVVLLMDSYNTLVYKTNLNGFNLVVGEENIGFTFFSYFVSKKHYFSEIYKNW